MNNPTNCLNHPNYCSCDCHKPWGSYMPPSCFCTKFQDGVQSCKHGTPLKLKCIECYFESCCYDNNSKEDLKMNDEKEPQLLKDIITMRDKIERLEKEWDESEVIRRIAPIAVDKALCEYNKRIERLEDILPRYDNLHKEWMDRIGELEDKLVSIDVNSNMTSKDIKPHKCPVCNGAGDFQILSIQDIEALGVSRTDGLGRKYTECHACKSKGVLWG